MAKIPISKKEFDPLSPEVAERLSQTNPLVTPEQLLEVVTQQLEEGLPGSLKGKARQKVLTFLVETEYHHDFKTHLQRAVEKRLAGDWKEELMPDNSTRVREKAEEYCQLSGEEEPEPEVIENIDQPVSQGGLTRLHLAAMDGEYEETVRLVEEEGARVDVLDNNKWTPAMRANAMGHVRIQKYLEEIARQQKVAS